MIELSELKKLTKEGESSIEDLFPKNLDNFIKKSEYLSSSIEKQQEEELAPIPRANREQPKVNLNDFVSKLRSFYIADSIVEIVGGTVNSENGEGADIDVLIKQDLVNDHLAEAIQFRLYREFADILEVPYDDITDYVHILFTPAAYTNHMPIYKLKLEKIEEPQIQKMSHCCNSICKSERIIAGYASVVIVDSQNQLITKEALEDALERFMKSDYRNIMIEHSAIQIGEVIEKWNSYSTHVDDNGLFIVAKLRDDLEIANEIWDRILKGKLHSFSIHAEVPKNGTHKEGDVLVIDKLNLFEISVTDSPANDESNFIVVKKGGVKLEDELQKTEEEVTKQDTSQDNYPMVMPKILETLKEILETLKDIKSMMNTTEKSNPSVADIFAKNDDESHETIETKKNESNKSVDTIEKSLKTRDEIISGLSGQIEISNKTLGEVTSRLENIAKQLEETNARVKKLEEIPEPQKTITKSAQSEVEVSQFKILPSEILVKKR